MNNVISSSSMWPTESAAPAHPALTLVIEDLDALSEHATALFTVCTLGTPTAGLLSA
ncbi:hypothetical protein [Streptomyces sp. A5-4]|uniref:hypothetical protein n=1 Tax=Streptomyces sp. A5-4 TaxID=3384771 RepID=UPI003DA84E01